MTCPTKEKVAWEDGDGQYMLQLQASRLSRACLLSDEAARGLTHRVVLPGQVRWRAIGVLFGDGLVGARDLCMCRLNMDMRV